ncbi:splicing factor [Reticulomyxa filosa]|uniref:Splicing factor n=1 Tax=Reticulomyxa filosa TaxID=46433 RepID=X6MKV4_RETFI|nr:splicing factor [Reticulomyxa filosa]|eukprot:ETO14469.1 splicing factor [Reticulomyxa filosa]
MILLSNSKNIRLASQLSSSTPAEVNNTIATRSTKTPSPTMIENAATTAYTVSNDKNPLCKVDENKEKYEYSRSEIIGTAKKNESYNYAEMCIEQDDESNDSNIEFDSERQQRTLFVGDISRTMDESILIETFSRFGPLAMVDIKKDKYSGNNLGYGFVEFKVMCLKIFECKKLFAWLRYEVYLLALCLCARIIEE